MSQQVAYLKNPDTGVIYQSTPTLEANRRNYIPCDKNGTPNGLTLAGAPKRVFKLLMNPLNKSFMPWTEQLSIIPGLIPCNSEAEGTKLLDFMTASFGGATASVTPADTGNFFNGIDLDADDAAEKLRAYALDVYGATLHHRAAVKTLLDNIAELESQKQVGNQ